MSKIKFLLLVLLAMSMDSLFADIVVRWPESGKALVVERKTQKGQDLTIEYVVNISKLDPQFRQVSLSDYRFISFNNMDLSAEDMKPLTKKVISQLKVPDWVIDEDGFIDHIVGFDEAVLEYTKSSVKKLKDNGPVSSESVEQYLPLAKTLGEILFSLKWSHWSPYIGEDILSSDQPVVVSETLEFAGFSFNFDVSYTVEKDEKAKTLTLRRFVDAARKDVLISMVESFSNQVSISSPITIPSGLVEDFSIKGDSVFTISLVDFRLLMADISTKQKLKFREKPLIEKDLLYTYKFKWLVDDSSDEDATDIQ